MDFKKQTELIGSELKKAYDSYIFCGHKGPQGNIMILGSIADQMILLKDLKDSIYNSLVEETDEDFAKVMMNFLDYEPDKEAHEIPEWLKKKMHNVDEVDDDDAEDEQGDSDDDEDEDGHECLSPETKQEEEIRKALSELQRNLHDNGIADISFSVIGNVHRRKNRG